MKSIEADLAESLAELPALLTCQQAAKAVGVDPRTVNRWAAQRRLKKVKLTPGKTGAARILKSSLLALLGGSDAHE